MTNIARRLTVALLGALVVIGIVASTASADFGFTQVSGLVKKNPLGESATQAASHPWDAGVTIKLNEAGGLPDGNVKTVEADLPPGLVGNPTAVPALCSRAEFAEPLPTNSLLPNCPVDSQVGVAHVNVTSGLNATLPVFVLRPQPGSPAQLGFQVLTTPVVANVSVGSRAENYALHVTFPNISQTLGLRESTVTLWGVPADPGHDGQRMNYCIPDASGFCLPGAETSAPLQPFITLPSDCSAGPQATTVTADSWQQPGATISSSFAADENGNPTAVAGCDDVPFEPRMSVRTDSSVAGAPTGLSVDIAMPTEGLENPTGIAQSPLRNVQMTLPPGMTVNASSATGLSGCTLDQISVQTSAAATCPESSKLGTVEIDTPLLDHPVSGNVYLATQGSNPFNSLLALYLVLEDPQTGIVIKLPGKISPDPQTGQLTASFEDNPQLPFETLHLQIKGGDRAPLVNPSACGTYEAQTQLTSWARPEEAISSESSLKVDQGCGRDGQFTPGFEAGTNNPVGGSFSPFVLRVTRDEGGQNVSRIEATLPKGLLAKLAGVPLCADAQAAEGNCPEASRVGTVTVGVGAGSSPLYVPQAGKPPTAVYLGGPYNGAPYSLVVKVPAQAGPFDLGTVAVRNALYVDPTTTQVTAKSDPLPQILQGIPISYRDVRVEVDRPEFTLNPTSCDPMQITSVITSASGQTATPSSRFQVAGCERLAFKPKLALRVFGKTNRNVKPRFRAVLTTRPGEANIARAQVNLPHSELLENAHLDQTCTKPVLLAGDCPARTVYGRAKAWTPLLDKPLEGNVYLVGGYGYKLPALVADLGGQIRVLLVGKVDSGPNKGIRNTFEFVPDAPVSKFMLELKGGKKGILVNSEPLCSTKAKTHAIVRFTGQNGKVEAFKPKVANECGKRGKKGAGKHGTGK